MQRSWKPLTTSIILMLTAMLALSLASCGGGSAGLSGGPGSSVSDVRSLPVGATLPALPRDLGTASERSASEAGSMVFTGSGPGLLSYAGGEVSGDSLVLTSTADDMAWAIYKADGLTDLWVTTLGIETIPGNGTTWYAALGNFTDRCWDWKIETTLPEVDFDLSENIDRIISPLGNMYWVIAIPKGGYTLEILKSTILAEDYTRDPYLPGGGNFLCASEGLPGSIELQWDLIDGGQSFELYRREACDAREGGEPGEFALLVVAPDTYYSDTDVTPGLLYEYEVRAINENGYGAFSNIAVGWAADPNGGGDPGRDDASAYGTISEYTESSLVLALDNCDQETATFNLTPETAYFDINGAPVAWDHFAVDMVVFINGIFDADGACTALAVFDAQRDITDPPHQNGIVGEILALSDRVLQLSTSSGESLDIYFDENTLWIDENGEPLSIADFAAGETVCVMLDPDYPEAPLAISVAKVSPPSGDDPGRP